MPSSPAQAATRWAPAVALLAGGSLSAGVALAGRWPGAWLGALAGLMAWVWLCRNHPPRRAAWLGGLFGTTWLGSSVWWLFVSMHTYGGLAAPLAVLAVFALSAALSLYLALASAALSAWGGRGWRFVALASAVWTLGELARGVLFTGFPWAASAYALLDSPWAAWAPWAGAYGMGAVLALSAAALVQAWYRGLPHLVLAAGAVAGLAHAPAWGPQNFTQPAGTLQASLLQTQVSQREKFQLDRLAGNLERLVAQVGQAPGRLVVAPETAVPLLPAQWGVVPEPWWPRLQSQVLQKDQALLLGLPLGSAQEGYTNSVWGVSGGQVEPYRYDKSHLVPFGEFIPPGFRWFVRLMHIPLGDFDRGPLDQPSWVVDGQRLAPHICYEDLFGEELARRFIDPARAPTVLVNVSNIAWFGDTIALPQHLQIARLRALELQRPVLRSTNTGVTAHIDHLGQVQAQLPTLQVGTLTVTVEGRTGLTPYTVWVSRWGLTPLAVLAALVVVLAASAHRRASRRPGLHS